MRVNKRLIAWILLIIFAFILWFFDNESVTLALLITLAAVLPLSFAMLRLTSGKLSVSVEEKTSSGNVHTFALVLMNKGLLPIPSASCEVRCVNLRTGETDTYSINESILPRKTKEIAMELAPVHAGRYVISVDSVVIKDPLGIFSKPVSFEDSKALTVMPSIFDMNMLAAGITAMPESDAASRRERGAVTGDMMGNREYVPGDPVRNIHWKLSEKTEKMLVRELGESVSDRFLIILDNSAEIAQDPAALDAAASVYASLIHTLRMNDALCYAAWTDPETGSAVTRRIESDSDASEAADEYLAVPARMPSAFRSIDKNVADSRYAHVVIVGSRIPENIENITNGCQATVLRYGESGSFTEKNLTVIGFQAKTYMTDTAGMEF